MLDKILFWGGLAVIATLIVACHDAEADVIPQPNTLIEFTPVPCPNKSICNAYHVRYVKANGVVEIDHTFPSNTMASKAMITVKTEKGTIYIWSER